MAGIYLHIPFCRQACHYCDFHFSTRLELKDKMVRSICEELLLQRDYLEGEEIETIYFGGGTPSLLSKKELQDIFRTLSSTFSINSNAEITLEANPDDLNENQLEAFKSVGINRLSIGVQSFNQHHLEYLNRVHNSTEAESCVHLAQESGFDNISVDLIYGIPSPNHAIWRKDLEKLIELDPQHISAYCLTIEEKTVFGNWLKKGKIKAVNDEFSAKQFEIMLETLKENGYEQYEISNLTKPGKYSRHNSNYWNQKKYLGVGPGAHSYNRKTRQFNIANNPNYIKSIDQGTVPYTIDQLSVDDFINEYILTSLRTKWGTNNQYLVDKYDYDLLLEKSPYIALLVKRGFVVVSENKLVLTDEGKLFADSISAELFK